MPWQDADPVSNPAAGQVLIQFIPPDPRPSLFVTIIVSSEGSFDAILRIIGSDGVTVRRSLILHIGTGLWASPKLGPMTLDKNERLQLVSRNAVSGGGDPVTLVEIQASFFYEP